MHDSVFDRYHESDSRLHRLDPRLKVVVTVAFIVSNALLPDGAWLAFGMAWLCLLAANALSRLGVDFTFRRSFVALPFAAAALTAIFSPRGAPLAEWQIGAWTLVATDAGLLRFVSILMRAWLSVQAAILLVAVTRFPDLIHALEHLRVPTVLTTVIAFLYRYLFVLTDEALRLLRARRARSASLHGRRAGGGLPWRARVAGNMTGQLFLRSYERSDRIYHAMLARGYRGQMRTLSPHLMRPSDWFAGGLAMIALLALQAIARLTLG